MLYTSIHCYSLHIWQCGNEAIANNKYNQCESNLTNARLQCASYSVNEISRAKVLSLP